MSTNSIRKDTRRILLVAPYSSDLGLSAFGGGQRTENIIRSISKTWPCDLALITRKSKPVSKPTISGLRGEVYLINGVRDRRRIYPIFSKLLPRTLVRIISRKNYLFSEFPYSSQASHEMDMLLRSKKYSAVVVRYFMPVLFTGLHGLLSRSQKLVIDVDDDPCDVIKTRITRELAGSETRVWKNRLYSKVIARCTQRIANSANFIWYVKEEDRSRYRRVHAKSSVLINIPPWNAIKTNAGSIPSDHSLLFVGALYYQPNKDGLFKFINECWMKIKAEVPDATLRIAGKGLDSISIESLSSYPDLIYLGFVPDLSDEYRKCRFTIAPIYEGGGSKIKILESMARGRPCVVTSHGYEGISVHAKDGEAVLVGYDSRELVDACVKLLVDDELASALSCCGLKLIQNHYTEAAFSQIVTDTISNII